MATAGSSSSKVTPIMIQQEGPFNAGITLTETNYDIWSQMVEMHIAEREKLSFIRGKDEPPKEFDDDYDRWYAENQKVKRWLLMSMKPEIMKRYIRIPTAREIWNALSKAFHEGSDELQIFSLNQRAFKARQAGKSLSEFYGEMLEIFQELDHRDKVVMKDPEDVAAYKKAMERLRVHIFLAGLDTQFDQVCGELLRKDQIPTLEECYASVRREEVRRANLTKEKEDEDAAAMVANKMSKTRSDMTTKCDHCRKLGHEKGHCYEIIGYPKWWKFRNPQSKKSRETAATVESKAQDKADKAVTASTKAADDFIWY